MPDRGSQSDAGDALAAVLARLGYSPETFARQLNRFAHTNQVNRRIHEKTPYKWLRGRQPQQPWPALIAAFLSTRTGTALTPADLGWNDSTTVVFVPADDGLSLPWTVAGTLRAATEVAHAELVVDRRQFLTVAGAALLAPAHEWLVGPANRTDVAGRGRIQLTDATVEHIDTITHRLRQMDDQIGGIPVLGLAHAHQAYITNLLTDGRYTANVGQRLHASLAEILRLQGWLSFDARRHPQAQRYFLSGLHAARTAGDDALGANIVAFMSCQAKELGQVREAVTLAATAAAGHHGATGRPRAILALRAAEAHAHDNNPTAVRRSVDDAFDHLNDTPPSHGEPDWCYWMNPVHAHGQAGYAYLVLGDYPRARDHLHAAGHLHGAAPAREAALRSALLATAHARDTNPDLEAAISEGDNALRALSGAVASPRCTRYLEDFITTLTPHRHHPSVRNFTERARATLR